MGLQLRLTTTAISRGATVVCLILAASCTVAASGAQAAALRTVSSDRSGLRVVAQPGEPVWIQAEDGRFRPGIPGFAVAGAPGRPRLPQAAAWFVVPPGTRPVLATVREDWRDAGARPLARQAVPAIRQGRDGPEMVELSLEAGESLPAGYELPVGLAGELARTPAAVSGPSATLGEVVWWRGRRVAPLRVTAVQHDAAGNATRALAAGTWDIRFVPDKAAPELPLAAQKRRDGRNDERLGGSFLNGELLTTLPTEAAHHGVLPARAAGVKARGGKAGTLLGAEVKIGVTQTRLLRVTHASLVERGLLPPGTIMEDQIRLYQRRYDPDLDDGSSAAPYREVEVPIHMVGEGDAFDGDDHFIFYALRMRDDGEHQVDFGDGPITVAGCGDPGEWNNKLNIYWLAASDPDAGRAWSRMATTTLPAASGTPLPLYRRVEHYETAGFLRENVKTAQADRIYANFHQDLEVSMAFSNQWAPLASGSPARIELAAAAYTDYPFSAARNLRVDLVTDGTEVTNLGQIAVYQAADNVWSWDVPAAALAGGSAKVVLTGLNPGGRLFSYLNWVDVSYDAEYRAVNNEQDFHTGDQAGPRPVEVAFFNDADLGVVEITDPRNPVFVQLGAANVIDAGGTWTLSIMPTQSAPGTPRRFWAAGDFGGTGVLEFVKYDAVVVDDPRNPTEPDGPAPDLVVVAHEDFMAGSERWIEHRRARAGGDLDVHLVRVDDIYNWYGGGLRGEWAVRRFIDHALAAWGTWAAVFVGDANENARELGVVTAARGWSKDFVPTHYHVQHAVAGEWEFMASDKWYAANPEEAGATPGTDDFPLRVRSPWNLLTGRFPCNNPGQLERIIDKVVQVETLTDGQDWRARATWVGDDRFSDGYGAEAGPVLTYRAGESVFAGSITGSMSPNWAGGSPVTLESDVLELSTWLDPIYPGLGDRSPGEVRATTEAVATPPLLQALSRGALIAHYQGHANGYVLSSEYWIQDRDTNNRHDIAALTNTGRPWVFFGMGCHIADWAQSPVISRTFYREPSLCEKMLVATDAGASATYGSSGYEYISTNADYGERLMTMWMTEPPTSVLGNDFRSRWVLGELMWNTEADIIALHGNEYWYRDLVSQFVILGDPLMGLDAGPPQVTAVLKGTPDQEVSGEVDLRGTDPANLRVLEIHARDEAGIDRLRVTDSAGLDVTGQVVTVADSLPPGETDQQEVFYRLEVPIEPYANSFEVGVWDTGGPLPGDRHWTLSLEVGQEVEFTSGGEVVDPNTFVFETDVPVDFAGDVLSAAWLHDGMTYELRSGNLELSNVNFVRDKTNTMTVDFTATAPAGSEGERSVDLVIDGFATTWVLQAADQVLPDVSISQVYSFPNPMQDRTRFLFETTAAQGDGVIRVFSVAGSTVARIPFNFGGGGSGIVEWAGRDNEGDELANGTYLYRVELDAPGGRIVSSVQRLVVMR